MNRKVFGSSCILVATWLMCIAFASALAGVEKSRKALDRHQLIELLESGVSPVRVGTLAHQYGIAFQMTRQAESELRDAGATDELIKTLRELAPGAPVPRPASATRSESPPVLLVEATPGGAQVYIDDEPVGTTSEQGRLKLSALPAGEHRVRLAHAGFRDIEQSLELAAGRTETVTLALEAVKPAVVPESEQASVRPADAAPSDNTPTLGVMLATQPPPGTKGVYISDLTPGGPADRAGLSVGCSILSIEGHTASSPQQVQKLIASFPVGMVVDITFADGAKVHTVGARLVSRSSLPAHSAPAVSSSAANPLVEAQAPIPAAARFLVAHDHGSAGSDYCVGTMSIGNGAIEYRSAHGIHSFDIPVSAVKEAKKNGVYLVAVGAFHVRLKKGSNYNFCVINAQGQWQPPDAALTAIEEAMKKP